MFDDDQAEDDRPQHVFDVGQRQVVRLAVRGDRLLGHLAGEADDGEQQRARNELQPTAAGAALQWSHMSVSS